MINNYTGEPAHKITGDLTEKKELTYTEKKALFGYLFDIWDYNHELFMELGLNSIYDLYDGAMIQNNELRFNIGEGVPLGNGARLDSIFLNKHDVLIMSFYDENDNELFYV